MTYCGLCGISEYEVKIYKSGGIDICFACKKDRELQNKFNITLLEYNEIFERQGGVCAICGKPPGKRMLAVDHCHKTEKIRGLLCTSCNLSLGGFKDSVSNLASAIKYLEQNIVIE